MRQYISISSKSRNNESYFNIIPKNKNNLVIPLQIYDNTYEVGHKYPHLPGVNLMLSKYEGVPFSLNFGVIHSHLQTLMSVSN